MPSTTYNGEDIGNETTYVSGGTPTKPKSLTIIGGTTYRMKAKDTTLDSIVYWYSIGIDNNGLQYTGPGPLIDITYLSK